jgi:hypothetical protein
VVGDERHRRILKLLQQGVDPAGDLLADRPDILEREAGGIFELPVDLALAGNVRAG